jgi:hypothetical protein
MQLISFALTIAAIAEAASAAQLLICSDSTTANYALSDPLQGYVSPSTFSGITNSKLNNHTDGATTSTTTPP